MKASEIRKKSQLALISRIDNLRLEISQAKKALVLGESQDTSKIGHLRRELAQTMSIVRENSLKEKQP